MLFDFLPRKYAEIIGKTQKRFNLELLEFHEFLCPCCRVEITTKATKLHENLSYIVILNEVKNLASATLFCHRMTFPLPFSANHSLPLYNGEG